MTKLPVNIKSAASISRAHPQFRSSYLAIQSRNTRQKTAIREAFLRTDRPLSPEEVLNAAQTEVEGLSIATVYRNIGTLLESDWLTTVSMPGETLRYEVAGKAHHHHFRCNGCGKVYELQGCELNSHPRLPRGFRVTGHEFFLFGHCADCAA
jgi:Fur family transcriptional regulator, ferric uptake regulator